MNNIKATRYLNKREYEIWQTKNVFYESWVNSLKQKYATIVWRPKQDLNVELVLYNRHYIEPPEHLMK